jgi:hypothetical protein
MKAIHVETESEGRPLVWAEADDLLPGPDEVLVENHATPVNRPTCRNETATTRRPPVRRISWAWTWRAGSSNSAETCRAGRWATASAP